MKTWMWLFACATVGLGLGCGTGERAPQGSGDGYDDVYANIQFQDEVTSQETLTVDLRSIPLTKGDGTSATLQELAAGKRLVVVFTRGYAGAVCPYCSTQTSRLIANYGEFQKRNAEVVVIYPLKDEGDTPKLTEFLNRVNQMNSQPAATAPPFPVVIDPGLKAVDSLGIRKDLAKASTYIMDADGNVRFAYVGKSLADRPSVKALLTQLDALP